jgi:hypothetical protein
VCKVSYIKKAVDRELKTSSVYKSPRKIKGIDNLYRSWGPDTYLINLP